jgi:hypothetical protein
LNSHSPLEWIEFGRCIQTNAKGAPADAKGALEALAGNAMLNIEATAALRALFVLAKLH